VNETSVRPDRDRLSISTALVLLSFSLARIIELPTVPLEFSILGLIVSIDFNTQFVMLTLATLLAVTGIDWSHQSHPGYSRLRVQHLLIPGIAALGAGAILQQLPIGVGFVTGVIVSGVLLVGIAYAEFMVMDSAEPHHARASFLLESLGIMLFIGSVFAIRAANLRAIFSVPAVFMSSSAIAWRSLLLRRRPTGYALIVGLIVAQIGLGLHYWPISALAQGILLGILLYTAIGLSDALLAGRLNTGRALEYLGLVVVGVAAAILLG
jgi:hypothetical protein